MTCESCVKHIDGDPWEVLSPESEQLTFCSLECMDSWLAMELA